MRTRIIDNWDISELFQLFSYCYPFFLGLFETSRKKVFLFANCWSRYTDICQIFFFFFLLCFRGKHIVNDDIFSKCQYFSKSPAYGGRFGPEAELDTAYRILADHARQVLTGDAFYLSHTYRYCWRSFHGLVKKIYVVFWSLTFGNFCFSNTCLIKIQK